MRALIAKAADGQHQAALTEAAEFKMSPESANQLPDPSREVLLVWALRDFQAAIAYVSREKDQTKRRQYIRGLDRAMHRLSCAAVLPHLPPSLWGDLYLDPWLHFVPFEDREGGFRYFEKHKGTLEGGADDFLSTAVRFDPARSIALVRERRSQYGLINTAGSLAMHWPDRIAEFLKPEDGEEVWVAVARKMALYHPERVVATLKMQPFQEAWNRAGSDLAQGHPERMKEIKRYMSEEAVSQLKDEKPDPFMEGR